MVAQAADDALTLEKGELKKVNGILISPEILINFFRSQWCGMLLSGTDLTGDDFVELTELEKKCKGG